MYILYRSHSLNKIPLPQVCEDGEWKRLRRPRTTTGVLERRHSVRGRTDAVPSGTFQTIQQEQQEQIPLQ